MASIALGAAAAAPLAAWAGLPARQQDLLPLWIIGGAGVILDLVLKWTSTSSREKSIMRDTPFIPYTRNAALWIAAGALVLLVTLASSTSVSAAVLVVANKTDDTVELIDPDTGESWATLRTGNGPHEVTTSPDGRHALISNYGDRERAGSTLTMIDVEQGRVISKIKLRKHGRPHGMAWYRGDRLAVTTEMSGHLLLVDPYTGKIVQKIATGQRVSHMVDVTPDAKRAFVANIGSGSVTVIDLEAGKKLRDVKTGAGAEGIAVSPDGLEVWVTNRGGDTITILDATTLEVKVTLPCRGFPIRVAFTPDGRYALVSCSKTAEIVVFDTATRRALRRRTIDLEPVKDTATRLFGDRFGESPVPIGLVVRPDGKRAWVATAQSDVVVAFDPVTLDVLDLIETGQEPDGMSFSPANRRAER